MGQVTPSSSTWVMMTGRVAALPLELRTERKAKTGASTTTAIAAFALNRVNVERHRGDAVPSELMQIKGMQR